MCKCKIIYNSTSGRELFQFNLSDLVIKLSKKGYVVEVYPTKGVGDATISASTACEEGVELIVVAGGDGTLSEVVNGIAKYPVRPKLAYIPSGTTNDFAKSVKIPLDIAKAIRLFDEGVYRKIDIGKINDDYFVYSASLGAFTKLSYSTPSKLKTILGPLAYYINSVGELRSIVDPFKVKITTDKEEIVEDIVLLLVINSRSVAGINPLIRDACLDDGIFNVIMLKSANIILFNEIVKCLISGVKEEFNKNGAIHLMASKIDVQSSEELFWNLDGERGSNISTTIECLQKHIEILLPKDINLFSD